MEKPQRNETAPSLLKFQLAGGCVPRNSADVASEGFEPPKAEPSDLQSDPFGRSGN